MKIKYIGNERNSLMRMLVYKALPLNCNATNHKPRNQFNFISDTNIFNQTIGRFYAQLN